MLDFASRKELRLLIVSKNEGLRRMFRIINQETKEYAKAALVDLTVVFIGFGVFFILTAIL